jgi:hypothetical protein
MNAFMLWAKERRAGLLAKGMSLKEVGQVGQFLVCDFFLAFCTTAIP